MNIPNTYENDHDQLMDDIDEAGQALASGFDGMVPVVLRAIAWTREHGCTAHLNRCYSYTLTRKKRLEGAMSASFVAYLKECGPIKAKKVGEKNSRVFSTFTCSGWQNDNAWADEYPSDHPFEYSGDKDEKPPANVDELYVLDTLARLKKRETVTTGGYNLIEALEKVTPSLLQQLEQGTKKQEAA